jgi:hypothetical protein
LVAAVVSGALGLSNPQAEKRLAPKMRRKRVVWAFMIRYVSREVREYFPKRTAGNIVEKLLVIPFPCVLRPFTFDVCVAMAGFYSE